MITRVPKNARGKQKGRERVTAEARSERCSGSEDRGGVMSHGAQVPLAAGGGKELDLS